MQDNLTNKIINEIKNEMKEKYPDFRGIYLFGSSAKGDFNEDSDYDLAIITNGTVNFTVKQNIRNTIYEYMLLYDIIIDNPIISNDDLLNPQSYLIEKIKSEGVYYG